GVEVDLRTMADLTLAGDPDGAAVGDPSAGAGALPVGPAPSAPPATLSTGLVDAADGGDLVPLVIAALGVVLALLLAGSARRRVRGRVDGSSRRRIGVRLQDLRGAVTDEPSTVPPGS
ncbi:MAG TPA: hypothetical protein VMH24_03900, partial [Candidatus Sulfotelmatobacter sp.]|nr:hypothetical protein [Candidatus Sulfotelmatobacter sp.]